MNEKYSRRFPDHVGMLWLQDVPEFTFVYIHIGNKHEQTEGCILVGDGSQSNLTDDGMVSSSRVAYTRLYKEIVDMLAQDKQVHLAIEDMA